MAEQQLPGTVAVIGSGTMGSGIAQVALQSGRAVILYDIAAPVLEKARERIAAGLERAAAKGRLPEGVESALSRLETVTELAAVAPAGIVIEAVPEDLDLKRRLFSELDQICPPGAILATNTSSLPVTAIAAATARPGRVVGMHFFNPVPAMKLVEVISGAMTDPNVAARTMELARALGKEPVPARDTPGFIVNRVARPFYGEALRLVSEGVATQEQVDRAMVAAGFRLGPFALMDLIGIDVNLAVSESVYSQFFGEPRFRPQVLQARMVQAGRLGRKTGAGFYLYPEDGQAGGNSSGGAGNGPDAAAQPQAVASQSRVAASGAGVLLVVDPGSRDGDTLAAAAEQAGFRVVVRTPAELDGLVPVGLVAAFDLSRENDARWDRVLALESMLEAGVPLLVAHPAGPVTPLAARARQPERVMALGGLPPYGAGGVVEVGLPLQAGAGERAGWGPAPDATFGPRELFRQMGLEALFVADSPGLIAARVLACLANEAVSAVMEGVALPREIDRAMELGTGYPRGPLAWADGLGLPLILETLSALHRDTGEERYRPVPLLRRLVQAGRSVYQN